MRSALLLLVPALLAAGCVADAPHEPDADAQTRSPYAGFEARDIKALSEEEIAGYRAGAGLGYAKTAELNSYPGPLHALELAEELELTPAQRRDLQQLREEMLAEAIPLGEEYLAAEAELERTFRSGGIDADTLAHLLDRAHDLEARLRFVHLDAHLTTRALLTDEQVARYDMLRGYAEHGAGHTGGHSR